jgi:hypothetical protein
MVAVAVAVQAREVGVEHSLLGGDAPSRVVHKQRVEKIEAYVVQRGDDRGDVGAAPLGKRGLEVRERGHARPVLFARRAEDARRCQQEHDQSRQMLCTGRS